MLRYTVPNPDVDLAPCRRTIQRGIDYARRPSVEAVVLSAHWCAALVAVTLRAANVDPANVAAALAASSLRDPYTNRPFEWNEKDGAVVFRGLELG
jgi:hypothetical protein